MNSILLKSELRKIVTNEINALPEEYIEASNKGILQQLLSLEEYKNAKCIMLFCSVGREPDTLELTKSALGSGKTVAFPYCFKGGIMQAREVKDLSELRPAVLGIPAPSAEASVIPPEKLDLIIVPALAFDKGLYRLGYGGGYYDRYLSGIKACTIGLARQRLLRDKVPREAHDVAVNCLVTEEKIFAQR